MDKAAYVCVEREMTRAETRYVQGGNIYCNHPYHKLRIGISYNYVSGIAVECECGMTDEFAAGNLE